MKDEPTVEEKHERRTRRPDQPLRGLTSGRMVHFVFRRSARDEVEDVHRPAIVIAVTNAEQGVIELAWFSSSEDGQPLAVRVYNCPFSEEPKFGTWHWIEPA